MWNLEKDETENDAHVYIHLDKANMFPGVESLEKDETENDADVDK